MEKQRHVRARTHAIVLNKTPATRHNLRNISESSIVQYQTGSVLHSRHMKCSPALPVDGVCSSIIVWSPDVSFCLLIPIIIVPTQEMPSPALSGGWRGSGECEFHSSIEYTNQSGCSTSGSVCVCVCHVSWSLQHLRPIWGTSFLLTQPKNGEKTTSMTFIGPYSIYMRWTKGKETLELFRNFQSAEERTDWAVVYDSFSTAVLALQTHPCIK